MTQLALVGKNTVRVIDGKPFGLSPRTQPNRDLATPLRDAVFAVLGKGTKKKGRK